LLTQQQNQLVTAYDGKHQLTKVLVIQEVFSNVCCSVSMNHVLLSHKCLVDRIFIFRLQFSVNETRNIHPKIINLSKRNLTESEIKLLKNGLKFTPTPNENKTLLGAEIKLVVRCGINYP
jgi:hypothetical protein